MVFMLKQLIFLSCLILFPLPFSMASELEQKLEFEWQQTKERYLQLDSTYTEKNEYQRPRYRLNSTKKASEIVYILHGFMGSPYEMKGFEETALKKGLDVYNDLIFGYGDRAELANKTKYDDWLALFQKKLDLILGHYEKVHLVGFSTGGLMISTTLKQRPVLLTKVASITLVSPFFEPDLPLASFLLKCLMFFTDSVKSSLPHSLIRYPDVVVMMNHPDYFMQRIPLRAAAEVMRMGYDFQDQFEDKWQNQAVSLENNIQIHLTENDRVLEFDFSQEFLKELYPNATISVYQGEKAPHHLMVPSVSKEAEKIYRDDFLNFKTRN